MKLDQSRRDLLLASLILGFPLNVASASATPLNPAQTIITLPDKLPRGHDAPAVIAICGVAPVRPELIDPTRSLLRPV